MTPNKLARKLLPFMERNEGMLPQINGMKYSMGGNIMLPKLMKKKT
jgi:hypothetical protein